MLTVETPTRSQITLPPVPAEFAADAVAAWSEPVEIDSYLPGEPDTYPAFLDSRVYQGSSGRVYPLPFHERISPVAKPHLWQAIHMENQWLRLMIMPELGGRIHVAYDKVADYDIFYRNNVIKPALVGLTGPWISGGVEFNWPQHHRPGTFLPTDVSIEREADGAITVWCSDHDPFARMKGMHGIRLRPDSSIIEARVRLFNRSESTQTFLWWANVAAAVGDDYQSFFPTDVTHVADHAKRAITTFPRAEGSYYGIDYPSRVDAEHPDADRLDWYRNIPVPTSYMVMATDDEFFGGYDHGRQAGFVHWASRDISPGKKQWTWGNAEFGSAWDANLTDGDGPYVELMAGVFTDNQPDFSYLAPGETKIFSQYWYPIQQIGPAQQATRLAAASVRIVGDAGVQTLRVGVAVTEVFESATVIVTDADGRDLLNNTGPIAPGRPIILTVPVNEGLDAGTLTVRVESGGTTLVIVRARDSAVEAGTAEPASEPPVPADVATVDELFFIGQYLEQYRHATRSPEPYWEEALRREPGDVRANVALAVRRYSAADYHASAAHLRTALARQSAWVPNPADGEVHYRLGLTLDRLGSKAEAERHYAKAAWSAAWRVPALYALAKLLCRRGDYLSAVAQLRQAATLDPQHLQVADLLVRVLRQLQHSDEADQLLACTLGRDPLDQWARHLAGKGLTHDAPTLLDVALDYSSAGFTTDALDLLDQADAHLSELALGQVQVAPLISYHRAALLRRMGRANEAEAAAARARSVGARYCLPSRLDDVTALHDALAADPADGRAAALLGHWLYDRNRRTEAIDLWDRALQTDLDPETLAIVHRNLGLAAYNVNRDYDAARAHYEAALAVAPDDPKLWQEFDQLAARLGESSAERLSRLRDRPDIVAQRDDLTVTFARLLTDEGQARQTLDLLASRQFQPWEGGEGEVIAAWDRACLAVAADALARGNACDAIAVLESAVALPRSLGEARHPLANTAELDLARGDAFAAEGRHGEARYAWRAAADADGDFASMVTQAYSRQTIFSILALRRLGDDAAAAELAGRFASHIREMASMPARIDYFATSLPTMLLFTDDPQDARDAEIQLLNGLLTRLEDPATTNATGAPPVENRSTAKLTGSTYRRAQTRS
jgi:tetratricopeptide (TPR) repeat protein